MALLSLVVAVDSSMMLKHDGRWNHALRFGDERRAQTALLIGDGRHLRCSEAQWPTWRGQ
jgi:hypothetical protein